ncbi:1-deoxy-D-xylulose-5-phosphate synthase [uncultured Planktosalinus sp.]|uniref:1-deoxy-D-xylulose-5-phosphate synthase n=1 Tax=uncultured Planktosalinus sp. TaxID=1810935 RepID=UPI0030D6FCA8
MATSLLDDINFPEDLRKLTRSQLPQLAKELRKFIIDIVATKEGHLGASLGVIELTIALHYVFNTPEDLLVWDVGHQAYGHKILTGRKANFHTNRRLNGISGFPKKEESVYDAFGVGHSSTAISATLGMAIASQLNGNTKRQHIAVVGDASIASGMAFEGLNHAGVTDTNLLVILNDNAIGIDPSVGALKEYLTKATLKRTPNQDTIFEALNFDCSGPVDGHNLMELLQELERLKKVPGPKLLHVITKKGKGLRQAEEDQVKYHAPGKFNKDTGDLLPKSAVLQPPKFQDVFGITMVELAEQNPKIMGISPAMPTGSSLKFMMDTFPARAFDVGIAEQHAVTFSAGLVTQGMIVFCNIYSTFLQRAYDQVIHDVCLQKLPVIFCLDRAGIVGEDGATHHGIFDLAYLRCIPNLIVFAPRNEIELRNIMYTASLGLNLPIAIRYPRGRGTKIDWKKPFTKKEIGKGECIKKGNGIAVVSVGTIITNVERALTNSSIQEVAVYDLGFIKPLDKKLLNAIFKKHKTIITIEDGVKTGGFGSAILEFAASNNYKNTIHVTGVEDQFPEHGSVEELQDLCGISPKKISELIQKLQ